MRRRFFHHLIPTAFQANSQVLPRCFKAFFSGDYRPQIPTMSNPVDRLSDEDKSLFKDAFNSFVKEEGGPIQVEEVGNVLRKMGLTPTLADIEAYKEEVDPQYMGDISYETMLELYARLVKSPAELEDEIAKAFRILNKDKNGFVDATELRNIMTTVGEALTEDEVDEMISYMDTNGDGKILYENFIKDEPTDPTPAE